MVCLLVAGGFFLLRPGLLGLGQKPTPTVASSRVTLSPATWTTETPGLTLPGEAQATEASNSSFSSALSTTVPLVTPAEGQPAVTLSPITRIEGLPPDIPIFTDNNGDLMTTKNGGIIMYTFTTRREVTEVFDFYNEKMPGEGWELISSTESVDPLAFMYMYSKDEIRNVMINISANYVQGTMINLMVLDQPAN